MDRVFRSGDDDTLIGLVKSAKGRLVVIAPALTKSVASAVADRMADLGTLSMTVILDADPEVYRLGYGDVEALDIIRKASIDAQFDLREQQGIRIAIVMSDDQTLIYSPVPRNIEAGSKTDEKPNAVFLTAGKIEAVAEAAGAAMPTTDLAGPVRCTRNRDCCTCTCKDRRNQKGPVHQSAAGFRREPKAADVLFASRIC